MESPPKPVERDEAYDIADTLVASRQFANLGEYFNRFGRDVRFESVGSRDSCSVLGDVLASVPKKGLTLMASQSGIAIRRTGAKEDLEAALVIAANDVWRSSS